MYTKEDIISERICITNIPNREELRKLQNHFLGHAVKESGIEAARENINEVFYRFYQKGGQKDNTFGSMIQDFSLSIIPPAIRASKTIDYNDFTYSYWKYTREDIIFRKLYVCNIPDWQALRNLALHMNIGAARVFPQELFHKDYIYRFFNLNVDNEYGFVIVDRTDIPWNPKAKNIIDYSQFTYGDKYTRDYVRKHKVLIYGITKEEEYSKLFNHMYSHVPEEKRERFKLKSFKFEDLNYYRFFECINRAPSEHGVMPRGYPKGLIEKYEISTCIPYSAFNYEEDKLNVQPIVKKEIPKLGKKWNVVFNDNHCIVNNVKWDNNFMKVMSDLLIRDMFEEMPKFEDNLVKILEYYELYE